MTSGSGKGERGMSSARHHGFRQKGFRWQDSDARSRRSGRRLSPDRDRGGWILEDRLAPASLSLAQGQLTYAAADGEANHLTVDVVRVAGVDYIRFREAAGVVIKATGKGLAADSG